jgi:two-component system sensor histidine kinase ChvG
MKMRLPFTLGLRAKLALVALSLLALPWVGYRYVQEMEHFLLEGQQQALIATARAVATALHERPQLMRLSPAADSEARRTAEARLQRSTEPGTATEAAEAIKPAIAEIGRESARSEQQSVAEVDAILRGLERSTARIWVVNRELKLLALAGSLKPPAAPEDEGGAVARGWHALLARIIPRPAEDFDDAIDEDVLASGREMTKALLGAPASRVRNTADGRAVIVSAAHPIWSRDTVVGAVMVEETTNSILFVRSQALERLLLVTLTVFALAAAVLLGFATRLSGRIRRLRDEAESAVDARGRLTRLTSGSDAGDEIGDLSRSFSTVLEKLSQHHAYLESLSGRLSHELRTPIAVVRSSLENLRMQGMADAQRVYLDRAEEGLVRLTKIFARMSEATRLEQGLRTERRERFDLSALLGECVGGYRLAYPQQAFELKLPAQPLSLIGSPDLVAQMLDKLVANAVDFSRPDAPIRIELEAAGGLARLCVANKGPALPAEIHGRLFESMISLRPDRADAEPHLGLGLYIARLVAEFHGGTIAAANLPAGDGVAVTASLPLAA